MRRISTLVIMIVSMFVFTSVGQTSPEILKSDRIESQQLRAKKIICKVFHKYCKQALAVSWCESKWYIWAQNGQYKGIFQMGSYERSLFGHGSGAWAQARAAYKYFVQSGRDWSPWTCRRVLY